MIEYKLNGKIYSLLLNGEALFNCYERFGREKSLLELIEPETKDGYEAACWMACEFSRQGELMRRLQKEDRREYLQFGQLCTVLFPRDIPAMKMAVMAAIREGFRRDHEDEDGVDLGLMELEQKKTAESPALSILGRLQKSLESLWTQV